MTLIVERWLALTRFRKAVLWIVLMAVCAGLGWLVLVVPVKQKIADSGAQLHFMRTQWRQQQAYWVQLRQKVTALEALHLCINQPATAFSAQRFTRDAGGQLLAWGMQGDDGKAELSLSLPWEGVLHLFPALAGEPVKLSGFYLQAGEHEHVNVKLELEIIDASDNAVGVMGACSGQQ